MRDSLALPDSALVRLSDPSGEKIDSHPLQLGKPLEIKAGATGDRSTATIFKGEIVSLEPTFTSEGVVVVARALDKGHKLQRQRKVRTFQQMSASDMVSKVVGEAGLTAKVESTSVVHEFFQQSAETDWEFIARLARMHDYRFYVDDSTLHFCAVKAGPATTLTWQDNLISFRPRVSGVQQVQTVNVRAWDPKAKQVVTGSAGSGVTTTSAAGLTRSQVSNDLGGGTTVLADRVAANNGEANALAKSALDGRSDAYFEAEGTAFGIPGAQGRHHRGDQGRRPEAQREVRRLYVDPRLQGQDGLPDQLPDRRALRAGPARPRAPARAARLEPRPRGRRRDQQQRPRRRWGACGSSTPRSATARRAAGRGSRRSPPARIAG